jgi:ATP-binding cassette, subfamily B, bacterial MsbA
MLKTKSLKLFQEFIYFHRYLAIQALLLATLVSVLEGSSTALVMPLLQSLSGTEIPIHQLPGFLQNLTGFYNSFPKQWYLLLLIITFFGITSLKNIFQYISNININDFQLKFGIAIRQKCIKRFLELELPFYSRSNLGELLSYVNEQTQRSETLSSCVLEIIREFIVIAVLLCVLITLSPILTLITTISLLLVIFLLKTIIKSVHYHGKKSAIAIEKFSSFITEILCGIRVIKSFNSEYTEIEHAEQHLQKRYEAEFTAFKYKSAIAPLTETAGISILLVLLALGSILLADGRGSTLPLLLTYTYTLLRMLPRINHLNTLRAQLALLSGSLEAIYGFLFSTENLHLPDGKQLYKNLVAGIDFENITFTFPSNSEPTLKKVSLQIKKGKTIALIGASGSGKSTLADLVMRFNDPDLGSIKIDGIDLREYQIGSWRKSLAMVSQDTFLFNTTIRENIAYACADTTELEVIEAAKKAYAYEFIQELPQGFDTIVGDRGTRLSGGQRQRIAIARAIIRDPDLLILDEATSALDSNSERIVQKAIEEVSRDRTVIVIAHRLSTIEKADQIVVLHNGEVAEQGTHQDLLALQGNYWNLYKSQTLAV